MERDWMTVSEYAKECLISVDTVRRWCKLGKIKCLKEPNDSEYHIFSDPVIEDPVAKRIKQMRLEMGVTQEEIAKMLGITKSTYSRYERGYIDMPASVIVKLAKIHGVSTDYILGISDDIG